MEHPPHATGVFNFKGHFVSMLEATSNVPTSYKVHASWSFIFETSGCAARLHIVTVMSQQTDAKTRQNPTRVISRLESTVGWLLFLTYGV